MPFVPPIGPPPWERILAFGDTGAGKTSAWLSIALLYQKTGTPGTFYALDADFSVQRMLTSAPPPGVPDFRGLTNVRVFEVGGYEDLKRAWEGDPATGWPGIERQIQPHDWLVLDPIGTLWDYSQDYFVEQVHGEDAADYFLEVRRAAEERKKRDTDPTKVVFLDRNRDWQVINKLYRSRVRHPVIAGRFHVFATASADTVEKDDEKDRQIMRWFAHLGVKPHAQKEAAYQFHTVLLFAYPQPNVRTIVTVKDRQRVYLQGAPLGNFAATYLMGVAGWRIAPAVPQGERVGSGSGPQGA